MFINRKLDEIILNMINDMKNYCDRNFTNKICINYFFHFHYICINDELFFEINLMILFLLFLILFILIDFPLLFQTLLSY